MGEEEEEEEMRLTALCKRFRQVWKKMLQAQKVSEI